MAHHGGPAGSASVSHPPLVVEHHPSRSTYVKVAVTLVLMTLVEVGIFYIDIAQNLFITLLLMLSAVKFALVVAFYMHLKFDSRLFTGLFTGGLAIAASMMLAVLTLFSIR